MEGSLLYISTFLAGVLMFLAPCTLPLLPAYLGFISGVTQKELEDKHAYRMSRRRILKSAALFVVGFSCMFIVFGALVSYAGAILAPLRNILEMVGGVLIILFGLFLLGVLRIAALNRVRSVRLPQFLTIGSPMSAVFLGAAFALGWTPCIGPILGTVLFLASGTETVVQGMFLLVIFSLGFAVPLLLLALLFSQAARIVEKATPYIATVSKLGGIVLVLLGLSILLGDTVITHWFFELFQYLDFEEALLPYL